MRALRGSVRMRSLVTVLLAVCLLLTSFPAVAEEIAAEPAATEAEATVETLSTGSKGDAVAQLQTRLTELGFDAGAADGIFGPATRRAVQAFQRRNGLEEDGVAGPITQGVLYSDDALGYPEEIEPTDVLAGPLPYLVNLENPVGEYFLPADLVLMTDYCDPKLVKIKYPETLAVRTAVDALVAMLEAAKEEGVTKWQVSAAYRTYNKQVETLDAKISDYLKRNKLWSRTRARNTALKTVAEPGCSEHHLGLAIDINVPGASSFLGTKQCTWLHKNCWRFGFIVRYQKGKEEITGFSAEAWHIRYVGEAHAKYIYDHDLCLEEYLAGIEEGLIPYPDDELQEMILLDEEEESAPAA